EITINIAALPAHLAHGDLYPVPPGGCPAATPRTSPTPFTDIHPSDYFFDRVLDLYDAHAISGYDDGTFRPSNNATRAQVVKIVVLAFNVTLLQNPSQHFTDVPPTHPFFIYIETAYYYGLINGYGDNTFRPYNNITR